jgi:hypothetical protein
MVAMVIPVGDRLLGLLGSGRLSRKQLKSVGDGACDHAMRASQGLSRNRHCIFLAFSNASSIEPTM